MNNKERAAMQQALDAAINSAHALLFLARDCEMRNSAVDDCYEAITALREALGENNGKRNLDGDSECVANHNSNNCCDSMSALAEQAEQEPVAWVDLEQWQSGEYDCFTSEKVDDYMTPLYAAPVRTKDPCNPLQDLTDDEIRFWIGRFPFLLNEKSEEWVIGLTRAVIAADRAKNNLCERTK